MQYSKAADNTNLGILQGEKPRRKCSSPLPDLMKSVHSLSRKTNLFLKWSRGGPNWSPSSDCHQWPLVHAKCYSFMQLLNNAGDNCPKVYSFEVWDWAFRQNYIGACAMVERAIFKLRRSGGVILEAITWLVWDSVFSSMKGSKSSV